jgi:4-hydroxy-2-oxoheptanedioate aldolase
LFFNPVDYKKYHDMGIRFIACGADATFVADGARAMSKKLDAFRASYK